MALKGNSLYAFGDNRYGQLGLGTADNTWHDTPTLVGTGYTKIAAGFDCSLAIKAVGCMAGAKIPTASWASPELAAAIFRVTRDTSSTRCYQDCALGVRCGMLYKWGRGLDGGHAGPTTQTPTSLGFGPFGQLAMGSYHALGLRGTELFSWGTGEAYQLGDGGSAVRGEPYSLGSGYSTIAAGARISAAAKGDQLYLWGALQMNDSSEYYKEAKVLSPAMLRISETDMRIDLGQEAPISVTLNAAAQGQKVTWWIPGDGIWKVCDYVNGNVRATNVGTNYVEAQLPNGYRQRCNVTVTMPQSITISLNKQTLNLAPKLSESLTGTVSSTPVRIQADKTWTSSNPAVAMVSSWGTVTAQGLGTATITFSLENGNSASCLVTVADPESYQINLSYKELPMVTGTSFQLTGTVTPNAACAWTTA